MQHSLYAWLSSHNLQEQKTSFAAILANGGHILYFPADNTTVVHNDTTYATAEPDNLVDMIFARECQLARRNQTIADQTNHIDELCQRITMMRAEIDRLQALIELQSNLIGGSTPTEESIYLDDIMLIKESITLDDWSRAMVLI